MVKSKSGKSKPSAPKASSKKPLDAKDLEQVTGGSGPGPAPGPVRTVVAPPPGGTKLHE